MLSTSTIVSLADYLNISLDEFIGRASLYSIHKDQQLPQRHTSVVSPKILDHFNKQDLDTIKEIQISSALFKNQHNSDTPTTNRLPSNKQKAPLSRK